MCFGAAASVWNFNGTGDALQFLTRSLLFIVGGVDSDELADSAFHRFADFFLLMGLRTKASKAQQPGRSHVVQGVQLTFGRDGATLAPTRRRIQKKVRKIEAAIEEKPPHTGDRPPPGGQTQLRQPDRVREGRTGGHRAHLLQVERPHGRPKGADNGRKGGAAGHCGPAAPGPAPPGPASCVIYADAFFLEGELRHKAGWVPTSATMAPSHRSANGWGYVVRVGDSVWYDSGSVLAWFIRKFDTRRAYIYMLEVLAQILAVVTLAEHLGEDWVAFIDNAAGQWALNKGYGRDPGVNGILSAFWSHIADPISRADCTLAVRLGWKQADTPLDCILEILAWAADDLEYAVHGVAADLSSI